MKVIGFGLNHKSAPLSLLERVNFDTEAMDYFLSGLRTSDIIHEAFGVSTCNRTEFLLTTSHAHDALCVLLDHLERVKSVDLRIEAEHTFFYTDDNAIRHLFQVTCGVDSLVVGENEILGQIRRARESASDAGHISDVLEPLLLRAIDVGRRARQNTTISQGNVSVGSVATTLASRLLGNLTDKEGLVLGAGETAETAAFQLRERGLGRLTIANRTYEKAHRLAKTIGAREMPLDEIGPVLQMADVVVCATGSPNYIITLPMVHRTMATRTDRTLLFLDVSVPRNVDPEVASLPGVHVYSLEDLRQLAEENKLQREAQVRAVQVLIEQELDAYKQIQISRDTSRFVAALHRRLELVRQEQIQRHGHRFDDAHRMQLDLFSSSLTRSVLHELVENLRSLNLETDEGRQRFRVAQELFNVMPDDGGD